MPLTRRPPSRVLALSVGLLSCCLLHAQGGKRKVPDNPDYSGFRGQKPPAEVLNVLQRQVGWDEARPNRLNPEGLKLRFEKIDDKLMQGRRFSRFRVFASGAPEGKVYLLGSWPVGKDLSFDTHEVYLNEQGLLMVHKPRPEQEAMMRVSEDDELDLMPLTDEGEPMRLMLSSLDKELSIPGTLVPLPVVSQDNGCKLEVRTALPGALGVLIFADGFPPKSQIPLLSVSEGEAVNGLLATDPNGHAVTLDFPRVVGKENGLLRVTAQGKDCTPSVEFHWAVRPATPANESVAELSEHFR